MNSEDDLNSLSLQEIAASASLACQDGRANDVARLLGELFASGVVAGIVRGVRMARGNPAAVSHHELENELWIHLQKKICGFNPGVARFELWLARVTHNLLIDLLRRVDRHNTKSLDELNAIGTNQGDVAETAALRVDEEQWRLPFSAEDWDRLVSIAARSSVDALLIVVGYGYSEKLTCETDPERVALWRGWFAEHGIESPDDFLQSVCSLPYECSDERVAMLVKMLPMLTGTARQRWNRCRHRVTDLAVYWWTWLRGVLPWSEDQYQWVLRQESQARVPVLCVDQRWHRSGSRERWRGFSADFPFRGYPPLLRFLEEPDEEARRFLFAHCLHGDPVENLVTLTDILHAAESFRQRLRC